MVRVIYAALLLVGLIVTVSSQTSPDANTQIKTYLSRLEGLGFSGVVLASKDGSVVTETAHGLADQQRRVPVKTDTIFDIGSLTKQFTATAILRLELDSKLQVTDPISKHLKDVPADKRRITIHHLLTHTSGMPMDLGGDYEKVSRDEFLQRAMSAKLNSLPGERHAYSNAGYSILGAIVEIASGQSYETFLRERLFVPAGMSSTGYTFSGPISTRLARGYIGGRDWGIGAEKAAETGGDFWNLIGNGGIHSTVGDMHRWMSVLHEGKVLTKDARQKLFQPYVIAIENYRNSGTLHYAYGWYVWKQPSGKTMIWHLGGNGIFNAAVRHHIEDRALVIYASNVAEFHDPNYPVPAIERMIAGQTVEMPPVVTPIKPDESAEYAGRYGSGTDAFLTIQPRDTFVHVEGQGQEALSFVTSDRWQRDASLAEFNALTSQVVESSRTRMYEAVLKHYGMDVTPAALGEFEALFWKKRHDLYGAYVRTRVLGTVPVRGQQFKARTIVAIDFERGTAYREYLWTPAGKIGDVGPLNSAPTTRFFPVANRCFIKFHPAEARESVRMCIEKDKTGTPVAKFIQDAKQIELKKL